MEERMLGEKSMVKLVIAMALPNMVSMMVNALYNIVDSFFVGQISEDALTALSLVFPIQNIITAIGVGFGVGINALIALNLGAKNQESADGATTYGVLLSVIHGLILSVISIVWMPTFLKFFTSNPRVLALGIQYSQIAFMFSVCVNVGIAFEKIFQAVGKMNVSMYVMMVGCITNIILDPILIFGMFGFPQLGMAGAALATGIGQFLVVVLYVVIFIKNKLPIEVSRHALQAKSCIKKLYAIGIPATLNMALPSLLITVLNGILVGYGQVYVVILGIYYKLQTFVYLPANGIIQGIRPVISYNYGAKAYTRVKSVFKIAGGFILAMMSIGTCLCIGLPEELMGLFTTNVETIQEGAIALRWISMGFMVSTLSITLCGSLEALGEGLASLIISGLRYVFLILPFAFLLNRWLGVEGVWHSFWLTEVLTGVVSWVVYRHYFRFQ